MHKIVNKLWLYAEKFLIPPIKHDKSESFENWLGPHWESHFRTNNAWIESKRKDDGAEDLWRVHDGLYDLADWVKHHPGGSEWIEKTKGTDITEVFEVHHINEKVKHILKKFYVRDAKAQRNSPFTFKENDFYGTLKRKVREANIKSGPTLKTTLILLTFCFISLVSAVLAAQSKSFALLFLSGLFLTATLVCSHNFLHMRNNWQMYMFKLGGSSFQEWRISHAMSHHIFPNCKQDIEIAAFEPLFQWMPDKNKSWFHRYASYLYSPIVYSMVFHYQFLGRLIANPEGWSELICFFIPSVLYVATSSIVQAVVWWTLVMITSSFFFGVVGLNAGHHHPEHFHDGDEITSDTVDWGLFQISTIRERDGIQNNLPLVLSLFGDHTLHHMFPTVDHSNLPKLHKIYEDTCKEFKLNLKTGSFLGNIAGQFKQLSRVTKISFHDILY